KGATSPHPPPVRPQPAPTPSPPRPSAHLPAPRSVPVSEPPPEPVVEILPRLQPGLSPHAIAVRFGALLGGLGDISYEHAAGPHLRLGYLFPLLQSAEGRSQLQGELFLTYASFGFDGFVVRFDGPAGTQQVGNNGSGSATVLFFGFGIRPNFYPSSRAP